MYKRQEIGNERYFGPLDTREELEDLMKNPGAGIAHEVLIPPYHAEALAMVDNLVTKFVDEVFKRGHVSRYTDDRYYTKEVLS